VHDLYDVIFYCNPSTMEKHRRKGLAHWMSRVFLGILLTNQSVVLVAFLSNAETYTLTWIHYMLTGTVCHLVVTSYPVVTFWNIKILPTK
jgi:hypothetical protein